MASKKKKMSKAEKRAAKFGKQCANQAVKSGQQVTIVTNVYVGEKVGVMAGSMKAAHATLEEKNLGAVVISGDNKRGSCVLVGVACAAGLGVSAKDLLAEILKAHPDGAAVVEEGANQLQAAASCECNPIKIKDVYQQAAFRSLVAGGLIVVEDSDSETDDEEPCLNFEDLTV